MDKLLEDGAKAVGNVGLNCIKGFAYLAGAGVGILVLKFGADNALAVFGSGVELLKTIIA